MHCLGGDYIPVLANTTLPCERLDWGKDVATRLSIAYEGATTGYTTTMMMGRNNQTCEYNNWRLENKQPQQYYYCLLPAICANHAPSGAYSTKKRSWEEWKAS